MSADLTELQTSLRHAMSQVTAMRCDISYFAEFDSRLPRKTMGTAEGQLACAWACLSEALGSLKWADEHREEVQP